VVTYAHTGEVLRCVNCGFVAERLNFDLDETCGKHDRRDLWPVPSHD
jgi:hypothetical protein